MKTRKRMPSESMPPWKPIALIIVLTLLSLGVFITVYRHWMNSLYEQVELQHRQSLIQIVSIARNAVEPVLIQVRSGKLSRAQALKQIRTSMRTMTYTDQYGKNYIFMSSYDGTMLVQPFEPDKELTNQWDLRDDHGQYIIRALVKAARAHPAGSFVRYYYYLPSVHRMQEKMAYVVGLPELQCYIGTGMYMQHAIHEQREILKKVQYSAIGLLIVVLIPISAAIIIILNRNRLLKAEVRSRLQVENELKNSEAKFRSIFENAVEGIYQSAPDGRLINVNPALARAVGYESAREMIESGNGIDHYYVDAADRERLINTLHAKGFVKDYVVRLKRRDGSLAWATSNTHVVKDEQGNILYYEGTVEDISARREAEEKVSRLAAVVKNSRELVNLSELDGRMVFLNETGSQMLGIDQEDVETTNLRQVIPGPLKELVEQVVLPALTKGESWEGDLQYVNLKTGVLTDAHALFFTIDDPQAVDRRYLVNISLDISRHKLAEEKFMKVFMLAPDGIAITRVRDGLIIDTNLGFEDISGWKRGEVLGSTSLEVKFWNDPADRAFLVEELKACREVLQREFQFRRKDGTVRSGIYSARPIRIEGEVCLVFVMQDITDRRRLEEERRKLEQQLNQSQKMDAIGQLASGVAHDFNNILTGIQGNASLMMLGYDSEHPHYQRLSQIEEQVMRGANLTRQLLGFARGARSEVKTVEVNDLIRKTAHFFLETRREIKADLNLQEDVYPVEADAGQIEQVLLNLLINAGHAMPGGGELQIQTTNITLTPAEAKACETPPGDYVRISVSDTGIGMDHETLTRIFEPFFTTRSQEGGTGLGLASAYGIIRNHGGAIHAYSELGKGSTFMIYLPSSQNKVEKENQAPQKNLRTGSESILLVDDEPTILETASNLLNLLGYTVFQAASGQEAVDAYREMHEHIDLVILDMIMPGLSGSQTMETLKTINPEVKVILSSGYSLQGDVRKVMESGCLGFIQKPYIISELAAIVHQVLHP